MISGSKLNVDGCIQVVIFQNCLTFLKIEKTKKKNDREQHFLIIQKGIKVEF